MLVAADGKRFCNEASSYHDIVAKMYLRHNAVPAIPCWLIVDTRHLQRYPFGVRPPGKVPQDWLDSGYFVRGNTIEELATKAGIDPGRFGPKRLLE